jgi:hypothetical protein
LEICFCDLRFLPFLFDSAGDVSCLVSAVIRRTRKKS